MKAHYIKIWIYTIFILCEIMPGVSNVNAADFQRQSDLIVNNLNGYLKGTDQGALALAVGTEAPAAPEIISWNATLDELHLNGGLNYQFAGHALTVKLGFIRGNFDAYTQTYITAPIITVDDTTAGLITSAIGVGISLNPVFKDLNPQITFNGQTVEIQNNKNSSEHITISLGDLLSEWTSYAVNKCSNHLGKKYCLVPQSFWDGAFHYGFIATMNTPLYYTTNLPQDFVELYKKESGNISYKPIAYSLANRLAFVLSQDQKNIWQVRPMTSEEIGEAMVDRSKNRATPSGSLLPTTAKAKR